MNQKESMERSLIGFSAVPDNLWDLLVHNPTRFRLHVDSNVHPTPPAPPPQPPLTETVSITNAEDIEKLPTRECKIWCAICREGDEHQLCKRMPCFHEFHAKCINQWLAINRLCPQCRLDLKFTLPPKPTVWDELLCAYKELQRHSVFPDNFT